MCPSRTRSRQRRREGSCPPLALLSASLLTLESSYTVRPNSGRVEPGQSVEVQGIFFIITPAVKIILLICETVLLQAMKADMPLDMKCKDKFLLQSTKITDDSPDVNISDLVPFRTLSRPILIASGPKLKGMSWTAKRPKT
jgi:hypothetical protein